LESLTSERPPDRIAPRAARRNADRVGQFLQVAFLPLPVIPHLKVTDMGLVDVDKFAFVRD
jgi:adenine deaminase